MHKLLFSAFALSFFLSQCCSCFTFQQAGEIQVGEPIMTTGFDTQGNPVDNVDTFSPAIQRIYCFVPVKMIGTGRLRIGARWYYEDELIEDTGLLDAGMHRELRTWLDRGAKAAFPEGKYRVEIYLLEKADRVKHFTVAGP